MKLIVVQTSYEIKPQIKSFSTIPITLRQNFKYFEFTMIIDQQCWAVNPQEALWQLLTTCFLQ